MGSSAGVGFQEPLSGGVSCGTSVVNLKQVVSQAGLEP